MRRGLFFKYVTLFVGLVTVVLVINAALDLYFVDQDNRRATMEVQHYKAEAAAHEITVFVGDIEHQIGWVAYPQWARLPVEQRRFEYVRLLRQVLAITELTQLDSKGHEQLKVSRLSMDVVGSDIDRSADPAFTEAVANKVYFGKVYYRKESEPYLTMAVSHGGRNPGVTVAEINLKLILEVITQIKVGREGYAYIVDPDGRLLAHPDLSLVLRGTDMTKLPQVAEARAPEGSTGHPQQARDLLGHRVLSAHVKIPGLNWLVFVELPNAEVMKPVIDTGLRDLALLVLGLLIAGTAAALLARRMVVPIRAMQAGAERIGGGDLGHRLAIKTGDELEALADQFNRTAGALQDSYETLEQRVEDRTAELSESLDQQTATADILQVISQSPTDVAPVLNAVANAALRFSGAEDAVIVLREGEETLVVAHQGTLSTPMGLRRTVESGSITGRAIFTAKTVHIPDIDKVDAIEFAGSIGLAREHGWVAAFAVPMLSDSGAIGAIMLRKTTRGPFTPRQLEMAETFAAQAVIAIQNVRLFTELRESLEQQTATADVLGVINSSPGDLAPVFDAMLKKAVHLCEADSGHLALPDGEDYRTVAAFSMSPEMEAVIRAMSYAPGRGTAVGRALLERSVVQINDIGADPEHTGRVAAERGLIRTILGVPLLREGEPIGAFGLSRSRVEPFTERQIELVRTFADQAVIAMENARLITETREALEQQTATAEVLRVISQSPTDVQPVLDAVTAAALRFCGADNATIVLEDGTEIVAAAHAGSMQTILGRRLVFDRQTAAGRAILDRQTIHWPDVDALDPSEAGVAQSFSREMGHRGVLAAPMLREGGAIGAIMLRKSAVAGFTPRQIELAETFAAQAVIAIQNVRLFTEIQEKSRQLEVASQHKSQFLANMSHELRTPLNAILGYTEMMVDGLYGAMPEKATGVLDRVQSNGRHLLGLINDVLDLSKIEAGQLALTVEPYVVGDMVTTVLSATESLARTKGIGLGSAVAPGLPTGSGDARRLTQVLLNLVGNAIKFTDQGSVEVRAAQVGDTFELSVVDTGFGIAPEDQKKIFEEFQQVDNTSTRKKGGTGLGLSISRKIVELHGGAITVDSEIGKGSTFKVTIPIHATAAKEAAQ